MYDSFLSKEECAHAEDMGNFFRVPCDKRDLNYEKYFDKGTPKEVTLQEFNSDNTEHLGVEAVKQKLLSLKYIREELAEWKEHKSKDKR